MGNVEEPGRAAVFGFDPGGDDDADDEVIWWGFSPQDHPPFWVDRDGQALEQRAVIAEVPDAPVLVTGRDTDLLRGVVADVAPAGDTGGAAEPPTDLEPTPIAASAGAWGLAPGPVWLNIEGLGEQVTFETSRPLGLRGAWWDDPSDPQHVNLSFPDSEGGGAAGLSQLTHLVQWRQDGGYATTLATFRDAEQAIARATEAAWIHAEIDDIDRLEDAYVVTLEVDDGWRPEDHGWARDEPALFGVEQDRSEELFAELQVSGGEQRAVLFRQGDAWWVVASQGADGEDILDDIVESLTFG
jgi:hypothetical protein